MTRLDTLRNARNAVRSAPPMLGASNRELLTMPALAMLVGDWPTAADAARRRLARAGEDEGALVALAVALWEMGREDEARAVVGGDGRDPARLRAAVRFFHHVDDPGRAQAALDELEAPASALTLGLGRAWRRHGDFERAVAGADRVLAADPGSRSAAELRLGALAERHVLDGTWLTPAPAATLETEPGRVLHLLQRSLPGHRSGSTYRSGYTVQAQRTAGLSPHVLTQPGFRATDAPHTEDVEGVPHHRLPAVPGARRLDERLDGFLALAAGVVERVRPAVLHPASDYVNALVALELGRRYGIPVVYEVRGFPEVLQGRWGASRATFEKAAWRRRIEADCWRRADRVVTLADVMRRHIVAHGVPEERVTVIPNAVDATAFEPAPADPDLRARLGIPGDALVVGYVSTLSPYEGVATLVEAVARLTAQGHHVHVLVVGDGKERTYLGQLARRLGIGDRVTLTGSLPHAAIPAHLVLMDVFAVPRTVEVTCQLVTPMKPFEAMAAGRAVVVARTEALSEMVIDGETGLTFRPDDPGDLARVLAGLIAEPERRAALGARAREWVRAERAWEGNAARYLALYRELGCA